MSIPHKHAAAPDALCARASRTPTNGDTEWILAGSSTARRGRAESFGEIYAVRIDTSAAGLTLTNADAEKNKVSDVVTIAPYRIGGREVYPAVKHEIRLRDHGAMATRYTGQCVPLPKSP